MRIILEAGFYFLRAQKLSRFMKKQGINFTHFNPLFPFCGSLPRRLTNAFPSGTSYWNGRSGLEKALIILTSVLTSFCLIMVIIVSSHLTEEKHAKVLTGTRQTPPLTAYYFFSRCCLKKK